MLTPACSPACMLSFLLTALFRGELSEAWKWTEESSSGDTRPRAISGASSQSVTHGDAKSSALAADETRLQQRKS